jgi:hypothetical protein
MGAIVSQILLQFNRCTSWSAYVPRPQLSKHLLHHQLEVYRFNPKSPSIPYVLKFDEYSVAAVDGYRQTSSSNASDMALITVNKKMPNTFSDTFILKDPSAILEIINDCSKNNSCLLYALSARKSVFNFVVTNQFKNQIQFTMIEQILRVRNKDFIGEPGDSGSAVILCENMYDLDSCHLVGDYAAIDYLRETALIPPTTWYPFLKNRIGEGKIIFCADNSGGTSC